MIRKPGRDPEEVELDRERFAIGRARSNDIVLEDPGVSRRHATLERRGDSYLLADLDSHGGTHVNGRRIIERLLEDQDQIVMGRCVLIFRTGAPGEEISREAATISFEGDYDTLRSSITAPAPLVPDRAGLQEFERRVGQANRALTMLYDLSQVLTSLRTVDQVAQKAVDVLLASTRAERGAIFLLQTEPDREIPVCVAEQCRTTPAPAPVQISSTLLKRVLTERKAVIAADAVSDDRFLQGMSIMNLALRSIMCAPLLGTSCNLGVIYLENNRAVGAFTEEDLRFLCAVAAQVALSIENAKFFDELKKSNENLEQLVEERTAALARTQLELYQSEKMASLSRLVAGVAHEINNPLGALKGNLDLLYLLLNRMAGAPTHPEADPSLALDAAGLAESSVLACARISGVVRSLSMFARLDQADYQKANVNDCLANVIRLLDPRIIKRVKLVQDLGEVPPIPCYPALLNEAFTNLLVNSCESIKDEGTVTVQTGEEADTVVVRISDTGCGIPPELQDRIFEPGFTTKRVGVGIALGLPITHRVIREHGGSIEMQSAVGRGTTFTICLPLQGRATGT